MTRHLRFVGSFAMRCTGLLLVSLLTAAACGGRTDVSAQPAAAAIIASADSVASARDAASVHTFGAAGDAAVATLEREFYHPSGRWNACVPGDCGTLTRDWGADVLADTLYLRWRIDRDPGVVPFMNALATSTPLYASCRLGQCTMWSDIPMWDAIADARIFAISRSTLALDKAKRAFALVDDSDAFARGACPSIDFQRPDGQPNALKTLETDSNYIKAALLLAQVTGDQRYVTRARAKYAAVRRYFLDSHVALYSVYVFDDGTTCTQLPHRFFASVNGNMIDDGLLLAALTGDRGYRRDAIATARAVTRYLSDASGIFANLQADNDVAQPLIEAMYDLATQEHGHFARRWLIDAARVAQPAANGAYERFFAGPPPAGPVSAWSSSGGLALAVAVAGLDPLGKSAPGHYWAHAHFIADPITAAPATIAFSGRAIALIGTIGAVCCEAGHVRVFIDGRQTFDNTGIWQNKSPASHRLPSSVLFSWRWPCSGHHTIALEPGLPNAKEGGSFIHVTGYDVVP